MADPTQSPPREPAANRLDGLDALRCVAALTIVTYHVVVMTPFAGHPVLDLVARHFHLGVPLFYVISAFSLFIGYAEREAVGPQGAAGLWRAYFVRRVFRIAPLYYLACAHMVAVTAWAAGAWYFDMGEILANLLLIFGFLPGWNGGLAWGGWSVGVEWVFYLALPVLAILIRSLRAAVLALGISVFLSYEFQKAIDHIPELPPIAVTMGFMRYAPTFFFGILAYFAHRRLARLSSDARRRAGLAALGLALIWCVWLALAAPFGNPWDYPRLEAGILVNLTSFGTGFAVLVLSQALGPSVLVTNRVTIAIGKTSYSLYLLHPIVIYWLSGPMAAWRAAWQPAPLTGALAQLAVTLAVLIPLAALSHALIERPAMAWGARLARRVEAAG